MRGSRPNIVMIMSDQHTPSVLGCYGNGRVSTPNIDRLAGSGVLFENAYCNAPVCVPSRISMLTGLCSDRIAVWHNADPLGQHLTTWPMALRLAGYRTVISGRMHLCWGDRMGGFGERLCGDSHAYIPNIRRGRTMAGSGRPEAIDKSLGEGDPYPADEEATRQAVDFLGSRPEGPFALVVGFFKPHAPFRAEKRFLDAYRDLQVEDTSGQGCLPQYRPMAEAARDCRPERIELAKRCYYGMVSHVDELVGRLVAALDESGLRENTLVVYNSDHGEMLGRHGLWHKMCFYEDSVRIPMIASWPGRLEGGARVGRNVSLLDIFPTLLDLAGAERSMPLDGRSLVPALEGGALQGPDQVMAMSIGVERGRPSVMLRRGDLKLILAEGYPPSLFDLAEDPGEERNLAGEPGHAETLREMLAAVEERWDPALVNRQVEFNQSHLEHWRCMQQEFGDVPEDYR